MVSRYFFCFSGSETPLPSLGTAASSPSGLQKLSLSQCEWYILVYMMAYTLILISCTLSPASPQSGKRGTICHEHECDENSPSSEHKRLSILRAPPRRHRHPGSIDQNGELYLYHGKQTKCTLRQFRTLRMYYIIRAPSCKLI